MCVKSNEMGESCKGSHLVQGKPLQIHILWCLDKILHVTLIWIKQQDTMVQLLRG